ncbi:MAG: hypothetical protein JXA78_00065 [Anaerolineales bacterium]|nr:hypothetical protein [Anaerolineales bacterium]
MNREQSIRINLLLAVLILVSLSCQFLAGGENEPVAPAEAPVVIEEPTQAVEPPAEPVSEATDLPTPAVLEDNTILQWAVQAVASSEYGSTDWSAMQAVGAPNTPECGDIVTAWASAEGSSLAWIELRYAAPVYASKVEIHQSYNPNQVVKVELIDTQGGYHTVYEGAPALIEVCPYVLSVQIMEQDQQYAVQGVKVSLDQTVLGDWNEIDAVSLVGKPAP